MLSYVYMQRAFIVCTLLAFIIPCIGTIVVLKRLSMIGDALSHTSLAGVTLGLLFGINPTFGSIIACVIAALTIEYIRKKVPQYAEVAISVMMSLGVGLAGVLSGFVKSNANFNSFLFGSIVAISNAEVYAIVILSIIILCAFIFLYNELFYVALDEQAAKLAGVPVQFTNTLFTVLTALTIALAARTIGALIVASLMVLPVICAMQLSRSFRGTVLIALMFSLFFVLSGLTLSFYCSLKPGGTIVLIGVATLLLLFITKPLYRR